MAKKKENPNVIIKVPPRKQKYIPSPEHLWQYFLDYVAHESANPWLKVDYVGQKAERVVVPLATPITFEGFECYLFSLDIIDDLGSYSANRDGRYKTYVPIIQKIRSFCYTQNFRGAAVGAFNANLIARKLGIKDQVDSTVEVKDISDMKFSMKRRE